MREISVQLFFFSTSIRHLDKFLQLTGFTCLFVICDLQEEKTNMFYKNILILYIGDMKWEKKISDESKNKRKNKHAKMKVMQTIQTGLKSTINPEQKIPNRIVRSLATSAWTTDHISFESKVRMNIYFVRFNDLRRYFFLGANVNNAFTRFIQDLQENFNVIVSIIETSFIQ